MPAIKIQAQQQNIAFPQPAPEVTAGTVTAGTVTAGSPQLVPAHRPKLPLPGEWATPLGACCCRGWGRGGAPGASFALFYGSFVVPRGA